MEFGGFDPKTKIWNGPNLKLIYHPEISIGDVLLTIFRRDPKKIVQICDSTGKQFTCEELTKLSIAVAENLITKGLKQDKDVIGIISKSTHFLLPIVYGAFIAAVPINLLDPSFNIDDIIHMFENTRPSIIFSDEGSYANCKEAVKILKLNSDIYILNTTNGEEKKLQEFFELNKPETFYNSYNCPKLISGSDQTAAILCSSGTTGFSKAICLTHKNLIRTASTLRYITREDILFSFNTLYCMSGLYFLMISACTACCRIITDKTFSSITALELIQKYKINVIFMAPAHIASIAFDSATEKYDLSSLKIAVIGGSLCSIKVIDKMQSYLKKGFVVNSYAMTETAGLGTSITSIIMKPGSVGKVAPGVEIKVINENTNKPLGLEQEGEICVRTGMQWNGYYNNEKDTKTKYDEYQWIHTGDLGYFDKDGFLYIIGRKEEIIKYKNFRIYPNELEMIISEIPGVEAVSVIALFDKHKATDNVAAAIVKKNDSKLTAIEVENYVNERVSDFKKLRGGVFFIKTLPMTASGKIIKNKIKEILQSIEYSKL